MLKLLFSIVRNINSVSKVTRIGLWGCLCPCLCLWHCLFVGQVMSPNHSHHMSQGSHVSLRVLYGSVFQNRLVVSELVTRSPIELSGDS